MLSKHSVVAKRHRGAFSWARSSHRGELAFSGVRDEEVVPTSPPRPNPCTPMSAFEYVSHQPLLPAIVFNVVHIFQ